MRKGPFRERDPRMLAILGTLALAVAVAASLLVPQAIFYARTSSYTAELANAAGLKVGDPVFIAGVPSGKVTDIELAGDRVLAQFQMDNARHVGAATTAAVKIRTVLGKRYLDIKSHGEGELDPDTAIPLSRTEVPFTLDDLSRAANKTSEEIDLDALRALMTSFDRDGPDPELTGKALDGIVKATRVFNKHTAAFKGLLGGAQKVSQSLLDQSGTLVKLVNDADLVASALAKRRDAIATLIADVASLSKQLNSFLDTNEPEINSLMRRLDMITRSLSATQQEFNATLKQFAPLTRYLANVGGHGPWGDTWSPSSIVPDNLLCAAGLVSGCS